MTITSSFKRTLQAIAILERAYAALKEDAAESDTHALLLAGEDTEFAPMLPRLFSILQTGQGSPADIGEEYLAKMRLRVPQVCQKNAFGMQLEPVHEMHELYFASH